MHRVKKRRWAAAVAVLVALSIPIVLSGCSDRSQPRPHADPTPSDDTTSPASTRAEERSVVQAIGLTRRLLPPLYRTKDTMVHGNQVYDQVTMDL